MRTTLIFACLTFMCCQGWADAPPPETASFSVATEGYKVAIFKTFGILVFLLGFIFLTVWALRRLSQGRLRTGNHYKSIKVLEKRPLSPKSMLYLVEVYEKKFLIAESQHEVRPLATVAEPLNKDL